MRFKHFLTKSKAYGSEEDGSKDALDKGIENVSFKDDSVFVDYSDEDPDLLFSLN